MSQLNQIRDLAEIGRDYIRNKNLADFATLFDKSWNLKKTLSLNISNSKIESIYRKGINAGAIGGKISGAGNGGFIFFYCEPKYQQKLRSSLKNLYELKFNIDTSGTISIN